jgi:phage FluMu protein Com
MKKWIEYRCTPPCRKLLCKYIPTDTPYALEVKCTRRNCHSINYRGSVVTLNLQELRCPGDYLRNGEVVTCNKLLARILPGTVVQVKCPRCKSLVETDTDGNAVAHKANQTNRS